jgi:hypothetical protein
MQIIDQQEVVEQLSSDAAHEPLRDRVHIRRPNRCPDHLGADALRYAIERRPELVVAIPQQHGRCVPIHRSVAQLLRGPLLGRMARRCNVHHAPRCKVDDEERVHLTEHEIVGLDEVARPHALGVILHERRPALAATILATNAAHVLLNRPLADLDPELEQLATDALGAP